MISSETFKPLNLTFKSKKIDLFKYYSKLKGKKRINVAIIAHREVFVSRCSWQVCNRRTLMS